MSKYDEVRNALLAMDDIVATEQVTTVVPFQTSDNGVGRSWTQSVAFDITPKHPNGRDSDMVYFQRRIVGALSVEMHHVWPVHNWSYGRAYCREAVGTMIEKKSRTIMIDDPAIPLPDGFTGRVRETTPEPVVTGLYRIIAIEFSPPGSCLYMMASGVANDNRNQRWIHEPTQEQLEQMQANMRLL